MATWRQLLDARRWGALEAQRARVGLGMVDQSHIDVFDIIDGLGIWLMFQPLDRLYGFYRRVGDAAGITINSKHPLALQRYTAAHELGHHVLGHAFSLDEIRNVDGARGIDEAQDLEKALAARSHLDLGEPRQEAAAQAFAANLLMPAHILNRLLVGRGFDRDRPRLQAEHVYALSLDLGASYEAAVTQLAVSGKISWHRSRVLRIPPIQIKTTVAGRRPIDSRAEVWLIEETVGERDLKLRVGDEVVLRLTEIPSSGYTWVVAGGDYSALEPVSDEFRAAESDPNWFGGAAVRELQFRAVRAGHDLVEIQLQRTWESGDEPQQTVVLNVTVEGLPTGDAPSGLIQRQQVERALAEV